MNFFDRRPEAQVVVLIDVTTLQHAERLLTSCEYCNPEAEIPFDWVLDELTCSDSTVTDYILEVPARCPNCRREVCEKTRVVPSGP